MGESKSNLNIGGYFEVECYDKDGNFKWKDVAKNDVVNSALNDLLETYFRAGTVKAGWALGLIRGPASLSATDTHASHGFNEFTSYKTNGSNRVRPTWSPAAAALRSVVNTSMVDYDIQTPGGSVAGLFVVGGALDGSGTAANRKGSTNSTPLLWATALLELGTQTLSGGDVFRATYRISATSG